MSDLAYIHTGWLHLHLHKTWPVISFLSDQKRPRFNKVTHGDKYSQTNLNPGFQHLVKLGWNVNSIQTQRKMQSLSPTEKMTRKGSSQLWLKFLLKQGRCKGLSDLNGQRLNSAKLASLQGRAPWSDFCGLLDIKYQESFIMLVYIYANVSLKCTIMGKKRKYHAWKFFFNTPSNKTICTWTKKKSS